MQRYFFLIPLFFLFACTENDKPDISDVDIDFSIKRLDKEITTLVPSEVESELPRLKTEYGEFLNLYSAAMISIGLPSNKAYSSYLSGFLSDPIMNMLFDSVEYVFPNIDKVENEIELAFRYHKYYFPNVELPQVYTTISGFNQSVVTSDGIIGISLDKYLGANNYFYTKMAAVPYKRAKMIPERIPVDCIQALGQMNYVFNDSVDNVLAHMIYQGRLLYYVKKLMPDMADTTLFGFSKEELLWCSNYERNSWDYMVKNKILFSTNNLDITKYTRDASYTVTFAKQSPGRAANWIGYRIISAYMKKNKDVSLKQLMEKRNYQDILTYSGYRP